MKFFFTIILFIFFFNSSSVSYAKNFLVGEEVSDYFNYKQLEFINTLIVKLVDSNNLKSFILLS